MIFIRIIYYYYIYITFIFYLNNYSANKLFLKKLKRKEVSDSLLENSYNLNMN